MNWLSALQDGVLDAYRSFIPLPLGEAAQQAMPGCEVRLHPKSTPNHEFALVLVPPGGHIDTHTHTVPASMIIVHGEAEVVGDDRDGERVNFGSTVHFQANGAHGFRNAGPNGFAFYSVNGGIRGEDFAAA